MASFWVRGALKPEMLPLTAAVGFGCGLVGWQFYRNVGLHNDIVVDKSNPRQFATNEQHSKYMSREKALSTVSSFSYVSPFLPSFLLLLSFSFADCFLCVLLLSGRLCTKARSGSEMSSNVLA